MYKKVKHFDPTVGVSYADLHVMNIPGLYFYHGTDMQDEKNGLLITYCFHSKNYSEKEIAARKPMAARIL